MELDSCTKSTESKDDKMNEDSNLVVKRMSLNDYQNNIVEKIEDHRFSLQELNEIDPGEIGKHKREAHSENDVALTGRLSGISFLKEKVESKIMGSGKLCKECFFQSIETHLNMLGIVSSNRNCDILEEVNHVTQEETETLVKDTCDECAECTEDCEKKEEGLLQRLVHRRTLSEIDWHELTRFAQGDLFDPNSSTAKEVKRVVEEGKDELAIAFKIMHNMHFDFVVEEAERCVQCVINTGWRVVSHWELPQWLRDNDFLWHMHRPQLPSFRECFCSMFRVHTETGNIWTHFLGLILVLISMIFLYLRPATLLGDFPKGWEEYLVFAAFFIGAILCLMFSWLFHTCSCHSKKTSSLFSKLDYTGIACMIMGSFVPCIYFGFYCHFYEKLAYSLSVTILGVSAIVVSLWDKFATPAYRPVRAGLFLALGCSGVIPVIHMLFKYGVEVGSEQGAVGWVGLMGVCYIVGALLYAVRVPERLFPGKCNLFFQSHQIFHVLVVIAAFVHLHGCCEMALYRIKAGRNCLPRILPTLETYYNSTITSIFKSES